MAKTITWTILLAALLASCGHHDQQAAPAAADDHQGGTPTAVEPAPPTAQPRPSAAVPSAGIANPASENCVARGGELEMQKSAAGEYGVCIFGDGSRCEEWRLFRGECEPGECRDPAGRCDRVE